jgi:hypothetical protein
MTDLQTTKEYYAELLLYQYINQPKARATIEAFVDIALVDLLPQTIEQSFNIETAIGAQLDIIGEYIGLSRKLSIPVFRDYFTFDDQESLSDETFGFTDYESLETNASTYFYSYINTVSGESSLNDDDYRVLLKLKLFLNSSQNTYFEITAALKQFFGTKIVMYDQLNMKINYFISDEVTNVLIISIAELAGLLPKPMGVLIDGIYAVPDPINVWAWGDYEASYLSTGGFSDYEIGLSTASFLDYTMRI